MTAKKFKIAVITYHDRGGGAEKQAQILSAINDQDCCITLCSFVPSNSTELASPY